MSGGIAVDLRLRPGGSQVDARRLGAVARLDQAADRYAGRSAILDVPPAVVGGTLVRAVKLKGVGWAAADGTFRPPSAVSYFEGGPARWLHVDYDNEGRLLAEPAEDRPWGALLLDRARNEDAMLAPVRAAGLPAPVPLGFGRFERLRFAGRPTGFVVIGLTDPDDRRAGQDVLAREAATARGPAAEARLRGLACRPRPQRRSSAEKGPRRGVHRRRSPSGQLLGARRRGHAARSRRLRGARRSWHLGRACWEDACATPTCSPPP